MLFQGEAALAWPEVASTAIEVVSALEKLSHDSLGNDLHKYNLKMRQLDFNVKVLVHMNPYFPQPLHPLRGFESIRLPTLLATEKMSVGSCYTKRATF